MINLSIIIPYYNSANSLKRLLLTIPKKRDVQVIVINDKSNKNIKEYNEMKDSKLFHHVLFLENNTENKGAGACRNIGLRRAVGNWLLFADSDDYFESNLYEKVECYFESDFDVVYFTPTSVEVDTGKKSDRHIGYQKLLNDYLVSQGAIEETRLRYRFVVPWSKLINRKLIVNNKIFFDEVLASNDVMFSSKVGYSLKKFKIDENIIYCVTRGFGTLTTNTSEDIFDIRIDVFINYYKYLENRLSKFEFKSLHLFGLGLIYMAYRNSFGIKKMISIFKKFRKNKVKILDYRFINPIYSFNKITLYIHKHRNDKRFLTEK